MSKTVDGVVTNYTYNEINQLVRAGNITYTYDNAGNIVSQSVNGTLTVTYEYDDLNRLISVTGLAAGSQINATFTYDDDGTRTSKTINGVTTRFVTDSSSGYSQILKATTGTESISYVRGFDLISKNDGTDTLYYLTDVTGTVRGLTDEDGNLTDSYIFDSFGNLTESTGTTQNGYGFQGEEQDETGLVYLRARYMDPETGRFLSMDTYGGNLSNPISQNRYLFANSNPVKYSDPSGHFTLGEMMESMAIMTVLSASANAIIAGFLYQNSIEDYSEFSFKDQFLYMAQAFCKGIFLGGISMLSVFLVYALALTVLECFIAAIICGLIGWMLGDDAKFNRRKGNDTRADIEDLLSQGLYTAGLTFGITGISGGGARYSSSNSRNNKFALNPQSNVIGGHNLDSDYAILGPYNDPNIEPYNVIANRENAAYFDMGDDWSSILLENNYTNRDMFELYNVPFLDDQIQRGNYFFYTIDPRTIVNHQGGSYWEYQYLLNHGYHLDVYTCMGRTGYLMIPN